MLRHPFLPYRPNSYLREYLLGAHHLLNHLEYHLLVHPRKYPRARRQVHPLECPPGYPQGHHRVHPPECLQGYPLEHRQAYHPECHREHRRVYHPECHQGYHLEYRQEYLHRHQQCPCFHPYLRPFISPTLSQGKILSIGQLQVFWCHILYVATAAPLRTQATAYQTVHHSTLLLQVL